MRIIGGLKKGKKLLLPDSKDTRPLKDIFKESLFNILDHSKHIRFRIKGSNILDLFAGVGSFGLECLSREANKVVFYENSKFATKILIKNIQQLHFKDKSEIYEEDIYKNQFIILEKIKFNIIFIDFPFKEKRVLELLNNIKEKKLLKKDGLIIMHRFWRSKDVLPETFKILVEKKYGKSKLLIGTF